MRGEKLQAFDAFFHTGKIQDYLNYADLKEQDGGADLMETRESDAHHYRRDCAAGEADG